MKRTVLSAVKAALICLYVLLPLSACSGQDGASGPAVVNIRPGKAHALIEERKGSPGFVILDVRTPGEYTDGHIENAVNIDYTAGSFSDEAGKLDRSGTYLVYCRTGRRSQAAAEIMEQMGFVNVVNMEGGITEWKDSGLPVEK